MGLIGIVRKFARLAKGGKSFAQVTVDQGAGQNQDMNHFSDPGDDSQPLPTDLVAASDNMASNGLSAVGYIDEKNPGIAKLGEKRIYSRDSDANVMASFYLKDDGTIIMANENGVLTLNAAGDLDFTGGTFTINGQVFADHEHNAGAALKDSLNGAVTGKTGDVV